MKIEEKLTFRLDPQSSQLLAKRAGEGSPHLAARDLLIQALNEPLLTTLIEGRLDETNRLIRELRQDLSTTLQLTLVLLGRTTPEEAKRWADKHLHP